MKFVTYQQYIEYLKGNFLMQIMERDIDYKILNTEEELYDEKRIKEVDKKHDKMFRSILSRKKANVMLEKINEREETGMSTLTKMVLDWEREIKEEKENAKRDGRQEGRKEGILEAAKKMLEKNMDIKDIQEITGISKKELENIKVMLAKT